MTETPDTPKLCKDCHWCDPDKWTCHASTLPPNLINGKVWYMRGSPCHSMRCPEYCGPEGRHWERVRKCEECYWFAYHAEPKSPCNVCRGSMAGWKAKESDNGREGR